MPVSVKSFRENVPQKDSSPSQQAIYTSLGIGPVRELAIASRSRTLNQLLEQARIECHGVRLHQPDWSDESHTLAITMSAADGALDIHLMLNAYWEPLSFEVPPVREDESRSWRRWLDTSLQAPDDICEFLNAPLVKDSNYLLRPRSIAALARIAGAHP